MHLLIEVSSGNVLTEVRLTVPHESEDDALHQQALTAMTDDIADAVAVAETQKSLPSAVVVYVHAIGEGNRLAFLETGIHNMLQELLVSKGYRLLSRPATTCWACGYGDSKCIIHVIA